MLELIDMFKEIFAGVPIGVICGIVAGFITFILGIIYISKHPLKTSRKRTKAIEKGRTARAKRIKFFEESYHPEENDSFRNGDYHATYEFEVNGKKYKYRYRGRKFPAHYVNVYWKRNPRFAWSELTKDPRDLVRFFFVYGMPLAVMLLVTYLLGGIDYFKT